MCRSHKSGRIVCCATYCVEAIIVVALFAGQLIRSHTGVQRERERRKRKREREKERERERQTDRDLERECT